MATSRLIPYHVVRRVGRISPSCEWPLSRLAVRARPAFCRVAYSNSESFGCKLEVVCQPECNADLTPSPPRRTSLVPVSRQEPNALAVAREQDAEAIVFYLVKPMRSGWGFGAV